MNMRLDQLALALALVAAACASFREPAPFDVTFLRSRALTKTRDGVSASAALMRPEETTAVFGLPLEEKGIQPLWLEIENHTEQPIYLLLSGVDPEYFPPLEVSHAFHTTLGGGANDRLDAHLSGLALACRTPIFPGARVSGFAYTNLGVGTKVVDLDFIGRQWTTSLTLFVSNQADPEVAQRTARLLSRFPPSELVHIEDSDELRAALEGLSCCAMNAQGEHVAPLNLVLVGEVDQWVSGLQRRGYRYHELTPLYAFGRPQDAGAKRIARWVDAQPHVVRLWQTQLRHGAASVWLAQASTPRGGRFAREPDAIGPEFDNAREDVVQDLLYCQGLARVGFLSGAGCREGERLGVRTDGQRWLLVFADRSISLDEIDFLDWERPTATRP